MSLENMLKTQEDLDNRIITEKGIVWTEEERFCNTLVALDVELSEFANEGRWFKVWSDKQTPKVEQDYCEFEDYPHFKIKTPIALLEEYVDGVHFFLSLANQKGWGELLYFAEEAIEDIREDGFDGGLNGAYLELKRWLGVVGVEKDEENYIKVLGLSKHQFSFKNAWFIFIAIGMVQYNFTFEQIAEAYFAKNKINHERQTNGY
ncbi:dUTP diphosphatase [Sutcliffiella horikoshii]|uniref:dUTP diphosphatase n=1 Tax=Sutcliffiella horikoshii TaxID=79883 RepID=UPI00203BC564|nr:dUTP diphosphatase [Sutcliffiella horikoshii]MCM3619188.1 dUTP diphosphatase [Sutcliffiella horikoshii]